MLRMRESKLYSNIFYFSALQNVFTPHSGNKFPQLPITLSPKIKPIHISETGVFMLYDRMYVSKSSGRESFLEDCCVLLTTPLPLYNVLLLNHCTLANYILNGHKLMLHIF